MATDSQVVIVGAGPVGMSASLVLGLQGIDVTVLEAGPYLSEVSRASTIHASTLELLDDMGVAFDTIAGGEIVPVIQYRDRYKGIIAEFRMEWISDYTRFPIRLHSTQAQLTRTIARHLESIPNVHIEYDQPVVKVENIDDGVITTTDGPDGVREFTSQYVIGADGAHSAVRKSLLIDYPGEPYEVRTLKILTPFDVVAAMPEFASLTYIYDSVEPFSVLKERDHTRVAFSLKPHEIETEVLEPGNVQERLRRALPPVEGEYPISEVLMYSLHRRVADTFRLGNVFLAGDAGHLNHPAGGMGMNSGVHDAYMLGKVLSAVIDGDINDAALDGYAQSRRSVAIGYVQNSSHRNINDRWVSKEDEREARDEKLRRTSRDPKLAKSFLLRGAMFDSAPRVLW